MNCLVFQRQLNADPHRLTSEAETHAEGCPACARRLSMQMRMEAELAQALLVTPPEGLADRVLLSAKLEQRRERGRLYALAASLVLAAGIGLSLPQWGQEDLAGVGIAHVLSEPQFLNAQESVSQQDVATQFARVGAHLTGTLPAVYAAPCEVPGGDGAHVVMETPHGRVTVLIMPNRQVRDELSKRDQGFIALVSSAKRGCYALVASNAQALEYARGMLEQSLSWT